MSSDADAEISNPIAALLTVAGGNGAGLDTLNVTADSAFDQTGTLTATTLRGLRMPEGIDYSELEALNIILGAGNDEFTIDGTHGGTTQLDTAGGADAVYVLATGGATTVNAGDGDDTIHVGSLAPDMGGTVNAIGGLLNVRGGTGTDSLTVDDSGDASDNSGTLTATTLTGLGMGQGIARHPARLGPRQLYDRRHAQRHDSLVCRCGQRHHRGPHDRRCDGRSRRRRQRYDHGRKSGAHAGRNRERNRRTADRARRRG